jgi:predicted DNA-binding transcriptional regulator YafY
VVEFGAWAADYVRERRWHETQQLQELPAGCVRLTVQLSCLEEIERWILSWGNHARVIGPPELMRQLAQTTRNIFARYASHS